MYPFSFELLVWGVQIRIIHIIYNKGNETYKQWYNSVHLVIYVLWSTALCPRHKFSTLMHKKFLSDWCELVNKYLVGDTIEICLEPSWNLHGTQLGWSLARYWERFINIRRQNKVWLHNDESVSIPAGNLGPAFVSKVHGLMFIAEANNVINVGG